MTNNGVRESRPINHAMKCVFIFESIHRVMKAEKLLKGKGVKIDLIPVPREISSDCGVAIELPGDSEAEALFILTENRVSIAECYTRDLKGTFEKKEGNSDLSKKDRVENGKSVPD